MGIMSSWMVGRIRDSFDKISLLLCTRNGLLVFEKYEVKYVQMKI